MSKRGSYLGGSTIVGPAAGSEQKKRIQRLHDVEADLMREWVLQGKDTILKYASADPDD